MGDEAMCLSLITRRTTLRLAGIAAAAVLVVGLSTNAWAWSYKEAAAPYAGTTINVLDEIQPLALELQKLVPQFEDETGIKVNLEILSHPEVIAKGQADLLSGQGFYDAIMAHDAQMGLLLHADVLRSIDDLMADTALTGPAFLPEDISQPGWDEAAKYRGQTYGLLYWNYNQVYWARADLLEHPDEQAAFKAKFGYDLAPAETMQQMRDIAEFFTRKSGEKLAGEVLENDFYGIVLEGVKWPTTFWLVWRDFIDNWGGSLFDAEGRPTADSPENIAAVQFWADLWQYGPPGQAEYSILDIPNVMGTGIAAQTLAFSDFVLGVDQPGQSPFHGKFTYRGVPRNADQAGPGRAFTGPSLMAISKHSENAEATYLYLQWLVDQKTQMKAAKSLGGWIPLRNSAWNDPFFAEGHFSDLYGAMKSSLARGGATVKAPNWFEIVDVGAGIVQEIGNGSISAEEGMKTMQARILEICETCVLLDE
jgi:multiple sugar transport system substrate-binding protein